MAYGESGFAGQKMFRAENVWRFAFFVLVWPVTGFLTIVAVLGANSAIEKIRPQLSKYARFAAAIAIGLLLLELVGLIANPAMARIVVIDIGLATALVAWMVLGYSRIAAVLLAAFEVVGIVSALQAQASADDNFFSAWASVAIIVIRLGVAGCVAMALKQGMTIEPLEDVAEIFA